MFYEQNGKAFYTQDGQVYDVEDLISVFKRQSRLINRLRSERDNAQQERNNLQQENPILRGQVERQRLTIEELTDENQRLRDAAVQAPFAKYEVYEDD